MSKKKIVRGDCLLNDPPFMFCCMSVVQRCEKGRETRAFGRWERAAPRLVLNPIFKAF